MFTREGGRKIGLPPTTSGEPLTTYHLSSIKPYSCVRRVTGSLSHSHSLSPLLWDLFLSPSYIRKHATLHHSFFFLTLFIACIYHIFFKFHFPICLSFVFFVSPTSIYISDLPFFVFFVCLCVCFLVFKQSLSIPLTRFLLLILPGALSPSF